MISYPIDPFTGELPANLNVLMDELTAAREAVHKLSVESKAESAEIEQKTTERAARYALAENARHPSIKEAAGSVGAATSSYAEVCDAMDLHHAVAAGLVRNR